MKYEVIRDKEDLYVLSINNVVVVITRDIARIADEIVEDALNRQTNPKRMYEPAILDIEIPIKEDKVEMITNSEVLFNL